MDFKYERIDVEKLKSNLLELKEEFENSNTAEEQINIYLKYEKLLNSYETQSTIASIRYSINTLDEFYEKEEEYYSEMTPEVFQYSQEIDKLLAESKFRKNLEERFGKLLFEKIDISNKIFSPEIVEDLKEENKLCMEYTKLSSSAKILFDGEERNLSQMIPYTQKLDRETRKAAVLAVGKFYDDNLEKYDQIYDSLVKVRDRIAKKLGFKNFVELGYLRLNRIDYNSEDVKNYRKQILTHLVPLYVELREKQAKRLNLDKLKFYDENISFLTGNPTPKGDRVWMEEKAAIMYKELSPETDKFYNLLLEKGLMDLDSKKGKKAGGYCTTITDYKLPFIFANFNGTAHDVEVLTHEAGHAFQVYQSMNNLELSTYYWPSYEAAEIHSMSMEFLTWKWMELFFEKDVDKFKYDHLTGAFKFIPYGALVDEFQHYVYENPEISSLDRRNKWLELEKKYLPTRDYDGMKEYEKGLFWFKQGHIFESPFYYIDYTLAQIIALQFWALSQKDFNLAWEKYMKLCKLGGSKTFLNLLKEVDIESPFKDGSIEKIIPLVREYLKNVDDSKL